MLAYAHETVDPKENGVLLNKISPKQYQNTRNTLDPIIYLSISPHSLLLPLHLYLRLLSLVITSSCFVLDSWRSSSTSILIR
jgi:hypothetical protein